MDKYDNYRDSGVEWIGRIPKGWNTIRIKYLFLEMNEKSSDGHGDLLSVSQYTGVTKRADGISDGDLLTNASTLEGYKVVSQGDLVTNIMLAWNGSLGFSPFAGITSPAYSIYRLLGDNSNLFFHYLLRTDRYKAEYKRNSTGVIDSRLRLYTDDFFAMETLLPPLEEQTAIAAFLDQKTVQIDDAIAQKEQLIELLKERKQIIIQRAVTRGLDETVKMKESGVEWIGEVPGHWEVKRLKYLFTEFNERSENGEETLLSLRMVQGLVPHNDVSDIHIGKEQLTGYKKVAPGDLVMNRMRAAIGLFGVARQHGLVSPDYSTFTYDKNVSEQFYLRLFKTETYCRIFRLNSRGLGTGSSGFMRLYGEDFGNIPAPLPSKKEQEQILEFINDVEIKIERAVQLHETQIAKLREYRTVLIDAAVTGKIKVS